jgi:hypothetical protein
MHALVAAVPSLPMHAPPSNRSISAHDSDKIYSVTAPPANARMRDQPKHMDLGAPPALIHHWTKESTDSPSNSWPGTYTSSDAHGRLVCHASDKQKNAGGAMRGAIGSMHLF